MNLLHKESDYWIKKENNKFVDKIYSKFPALKYKNFRYFLEGQCVSMIGTWVQKTAQQWLAYSITKSAFLLGLLGVFQFIPMLLFSLFAGVLVDRYPKKRFLIITQSLQMLQALIFAVLIWSGCIRYWHILILACLYGCVQTFDMPTRQSFFIELVGKRDLPSAIGLNSSIANVARIVGPAIAGVLIYKFGTALCFFLNGLSFISVLIGLVKIKSYAVNIRKSNDRIIKDIADGIKYIISQKTIFMCIVSMLFVGTFAFNNEVIIPVFTYEILHKGASEYSILLSAVGIGSLIGALQFASKTKFKINIIFQAAIGISLCLVFLGITRSFFIAVILLIILGYFNLTFMSSVNSTIQINSSDEYRGRTVSVYSLVMLGTTPIGNFMAGSVGQCFGANISFFVCGLITLILMLGVMINSKMKKY